MKKNVASQVIAAQMNSKTDGSAVTTGTTTVYVLGDGGTQGAGSGTVTHEGNGCWSYVPTQAETNYDHVAFTFINTSAVGVTVQVYPAFPQTGDNYARLGAPAGASVSADIAAAKVDTAAIKVKTDYLPSATAGAAGGVFIAGSNAATSITTALTANITGNLSGSVGSVTGAVGSVTGAVGSVSAGGITASSIAADAIGASELAADAIAEIADAVWDEVLSGHLTAGSTGNALNAAGSAGDPWSTSIPGAYGAGSAGYIIGTYLDGAISGIPTATENADALLKRDMSAVTGESARSPLNALRFLRNKWVVSGTTLTVTKEDDATSAWTATVTATAGADPITGSDPA